MSRHHDYRSSTGILESPRFDADRFPLDHRGPPVMERPRRADAERFESRLRDIDEHGPPARRPGRYYDDDHLVRPGPMVAYDRPRGVSPPPRPRLVRRQSSLDTFDRIPSRKLDEYYSCGPPPRPSPAPMPPRPRYSPPRRPYDPEDYYYDDIGIAEPDYYGDEELRGVRERDPYATRPRRSSGRFHEQMVDDRPYPRKGKTRMPKKLVHPRAIIDKGYPFEEQENVVMIQLALSKDQIDELVSVSREIRRRNDARIVRTSPSPVRHSVDHLSVPTYSPRSSHGTLLIERSPSRHSHSRHRSHSRHHHHRSPSDHHPMTSIVSRPRSTSDIGHRRHRSSPGRGAQTRDESDKLHTGPLAIMVRPRDSDEDLRQLDRRGSGELVRRSDFLDADVEQEEVKRDRKTPNSRIIRAMMATLT